MTRVTIIDIEPEIEAEFQRLMREFPEVYLKIIQQRAAEKYESERSREWYRLNKERKREYNRRYRLKLKLKNNYF